MAKTSCDWTVERLPWWVNGTLEEAEAERVAAHLAECATCRDELAATRGALALYGAHLPIEALLALVEGEAGEHEVGEAGRAAGDAVPSRQAVLSSEVVSAHLGHCRPCREQLALLRESRETVEEESTTGEPAGERVTPFAPRRAEPSPPVRSRRWVDRRGLAIAASLLLCVVAAGGWISSGLTAERRGDRIAELERRLAEATAARDEETPRGAKAAEWAADEASAVLAAAAAEIAELEAELERSRREPVGSERVADSIGIGLAETWDLQPRVTRGDARRIEAPPIEVPAGEELLALYLTGLGDQPLTLVVDNAAGDRLLERGGLTDTTAAGIDPARILTLPLAGLPPGETLALRLLADGEVMAMRSLRIAR